MAAAPSEKALVPFVSVANMMRLVRGLGVEATLAGLAAEIEADFRRWQAFDKTPRVAAHSREGVIELMPTSDGTLYGFKYVNGHPKNAAGGLQTVTALGLMAEVASGYPVLLAEMTLLTALRTAATSAVAARLLAPTPARVMALIGAGAQSEFQALALKGACGVESIRVFDVDAAASAKFARNLAGAGLDIRLCRTPEEAVEGAAIITTCTADKRRASVLHDNMVGDGVHVNAIGGDCPGKTELQPALLERAAVFVEYEPQTRLEGDIQQMAPDFPVTELWEVIAGRKPGRRTAREVTVFDGVGFAIEDFAALRFVREKIAGTDCYENLDLIADPDEPRDLYGMLMRAG